MNFLVRKPWQLPQSMHTPEDVYQNRKLYRREFLAAIGAGAAVGLGIGCDQGTDEEVKQGGAVAVPESLTERDTKDSEEKKGGADADNPFHAKRNEEFTYGRPETREEDAARYTNFYEFSSGKDNWWRVGDFEPLPWKFEITGLCAKPQTFDIDDIYKKMAFEERQYRHRCVETWAMCVPWIGFPLRDLLKRVEPSPKAKFVALQTFNQPNAADEKAGLPTFDGPNMGASFFGGPWPWPYTEGLTMAEATNELAFIATGIYGKPLAKQHGAPIRLVVPWKYGFKSAKSIVRITLTDKQPETFWNTYLPQWYGFEANVNPDVPHPNWSQATEWMLPSRDDVHDTKIYNGYGEYVAKLYA